MDYKLMISTFGMIFLAELGDKTQVATFALAANHKVRFAVFLCASGALILTSLLAAVFGSARGGLIPLYYTNPGAGAFYLYNGRVDAVL